MDCSCRAYISVSHVASGGSVGQTSPQCMYVFILQQDNTQNIKPEGQQGSEALIAARNKNVSNKY